MSWLLATLVLVFAADRAAKVLVFGAPAETVGMAWGCLSIRPTRNKRPMMWPRGAPRAWAASLVLAFAAALAIVALQPRPSAALCIGLGAALGGALGNLYDHWRHGAVLDFLHVGIGGRFNPADCALVAGLFTALASHVAAATSFLSKG